MIERGDIQLSKRGPVIAISGPPGSGKSTLCRALVDRIGSGPPVSYDDFETMTRQPPEVVDAWMARGAPYSEIETPGLTEALDAAATRGVVVFETQLGRAYPHTSHLIDFSVWLTCPEDVALARKVRQFVSEARGLPSNRLVQFHGWLAGYLEAYEKIVRPACAQQRDRVRPLADLSLDAETPISGLVETVLAEIEGLIGKSS
ncbi:hypothetical protein LP7551_04931 [Roseibium album]|nr:hypothetical protein LP7551_04931 [Roseibium album]